MKMQKPRVLYTWKLSDFGKIGLAHNPGKRKAGKLMANNFKNKSANPNTKPEQNHKPDKAPSMDSRDGHGLSKDQVLQGKD
jgi:hypothetical protein